MISEIDINTLRLALDDRSTMFFLWQKMSPRIEAEIVRNEKWIPENVDSDEVKTRALQGLIRATKKYVDNHEKFDKPVDFEDYAIWWIRQSINDREN